MAANLHIINKQVYEFDCLNEEHAFQMQHKADRLLMERISKSIGKICDQMSAGDENLQIQLLEIDLGKIAFDHFEERLLLEFEKVFFEKLLEWKNKNAVARATPVSKRENDFNILKYFLHKGNIPWFAGKPDKNYISELVGEVFADNPEWLKKFILLNLGDEKFIERLIREIDEAGADHIISLLDIDTSIISKIEDGIIQLLQAMLSLDLTQIDNASEDEKNTIEVEKEIGQFKKLTALLKKVLISLDLTQIDNAGEDEKNTIGVEKEIRQFKKITALLKKVLETRTDTGEDHIHKIAIELSLRLFSKKIEFLNAGELFIFLNKIIADKFNIGNTILKSALLQIKTEPTALFDAIMDQKKKLENNKTHFEMELPPEEEAVDNMKFYISNAGLILLANYFPAFFNELQFLEDGRFISDQHQSKAVFLLHYLCTGEESTPEYILPLNKILCGMSMDDPLSFSISLDEKEKNECNELLTEIINNWQKLGNSSIDALRESFLNREGILLLEENGWKLRIERKGYDVLLDSIPWSFQHIKLNWMDTIITTEW